MGGFHLEMPQGTVGLVLPRRGYSHAKGPCGSKAWWHWLVVGGSLPSVVPTPPHGVVSNRWPLAPLPLQPRYQPMDGSWERLASMTCGRCYFAAGALGGFIYALGGSSGELYCTDTVERYDLANDTWR